MDTTKATKADESTGIKGADDFIAAAKSLGLRTEVSVLHNEAILYSDGEVMVSPSTSVGVRVYINVPESLSISALALVERNTTLLSCWSKFHNGRARGRWTSGNYSTLGGSDDMHTFKRCMVYLSIMGDNAARLRKYDEEG